MATDPHEIKELYKSVEPVKVRADSLQAGHPCRDPGGTAVTVKCFGFQWIGQALAEAGLLPTCIRWSIAWPEVSG